MISANVMRTCSATLVALLTIGCAYHSPDAPSSVTPISTSAPFSLTLGTTVGIGVDAGRATVTAKVQNVNGASLSGVTVQFTTDAGTLSAASVVTGVEGTATTTITSASTAAITATAGALTAKTLVVSEPIVIPPPAPPDPIPTPAPPSPGPLSVTLSTADVTIGTQTIVSAQVTNGPPQSLAWSFGDGATFAGTSTTTAHTYGAVGSYVIGVTVRDTNGRTAIASTTTTVNAVPPPPTPAPPPAPSYGVTLVASPTTVAAGESATLTATVVLINGATAPTGFAWDCDGDGTADPPIAANTKVCAYPIVGAISSMVTVTGSASASATTAVTVTPIPLVVAITGNATVTVGVPITFTATVTSAGPVPLTLQWEWDDDGDGNVDFVIAGQPSPNLRTTSYSSVGAKPVKVRVTDPATGRVATASRTVTVS
jgi:adhesin/invasin